MDPLNSNEMNTFNTERLSLSYLTSADAEFIKELVNSAGWLEFIGDRNVNTTDDALTYVNKIINDPNFQYWVVRLKETGVPIGTLSFIQRDYLEHPDIGYAFLPQFGKKGYAQEAASVVMESLIANPQIKTVLATVKPGNLSSIRLLEKLGLHYVKQIEVNGNHPLLYAYNKENH